MIALNVITKTGAIGLFLLFLLPQILGRTANMIAFTKNKILRLPTLRTRTMRTRTRDSSPSNLISPGLIPLRLPRLDLPIETRARETLDIRSSLASGLVLPQISLRDPQV